MHWNILANTYYVVFFRAVWSGKYWKYMLHECCATGFVKLVRNCSSIKLISLYLPDNLLSILISQLLSWKISWLHSFNQYILAPCSFKCFDPCALMPCNKIWIGKNIGHNHLLHRILLCNYFYQSTTHTILPGVQQFFQGS